MAVIAALLLIAGTGALLAAAYMAATPLGVAATGLACLALAYGLIPTDEDN